MIDTTRATFPIVVHALLVRGDRILLLRRANTGYMDGFYVPPGGHLRRGEGLVEAVLRECREEAGVTVERAEVELVAAMPYRDGDHQGVDFIARAVQWSGEPILAEPQRFDDLVWADPAHLPSPVAPFVPAALELVSDGGWFRELID